MFEQLKHIDHQLFTLINLTFSNPVFDFICPILREKKTWIPFYVAGSIGCIWKYKKQSFYIFIPLILTIVFSDQCSNLIKLFFHRARPCDNLATQMQLILRVSHCPKTFSFTSNHATNHFALAAFLGLFFNSNKWLLPALLCWAFCISFSQVYVGVHFPADVMAGGIIGIFWGWLATFISRKYISI